MVSHLPVSTSKSFVESSTQTSLFQGDSSSDSSQLAQEQLVPTTSGTQLMSGSAAGASAVSTSTEEDCLRFIMANQESSAHDFLRFALDRRKGIGPEEVDFIEKYKKLSTTRQYNSCWKHWVSFLHEHRPSSISWNFCISFFISLHKKGLASTTISSYKSALSRPMFYGFNIDFDSDLFNKIPKACSNINPDPPPKPISWSLGKVLQFASAIDVQDTSLRLLLGKTLFLIAMASGARLSEVVALVRDRDHIQFGDSGEALLYPDPFFLAKNELPTKRRGPMRIRPLPEDPSLCPVVCLKKYLQVTAAIKEGPLFWGETVSSILSIKQVRAKILYFIKAADPDSVPHGHDVRKVATTINYFHHMSFSDLQVVTGWKSPRVFFKHYLKQLEEVQHCLIAAGSLVTPAT